MSKYNIEIEFNNKVAISSVQALNTQLNQLDAKIKSINKSSNFSKSFSEGIRGIEKNARQAASGIDKLNQSVSKTPGYFKTLQRWATAALSVFSVQKIIRASDAYTEVGNKIRALSGDTADYVSVQNELFSIAQRSRVDISATAQLYTRLTQAQQNLGASTEDLLRFTEGVGKALQISGASAFTQRGVLLQLSQAMGTDIVRAEEFNSILEGGIRIAKAAAEGIDGLNGSVTALRKRVIDGKVSSQEFFNAIMSQLPKLEAEFARTTPTIAQAITMFNNEMTAWVGGMNDATGASSILAKIIIDLGANIQPLITSILAGATAFTALSIKANLATKSLNAFSIASLKAAAKNPIAAAIIAAATAYLYLRESITSSNRELGRANSLIERNGQILENLDDQTKQSLESQVKLTQAKIDSLNVEIEMLETGQKTVGYTDLLKASWDGVSNAIGSAWDKAKGFADVVTGGPIVRFLDRIMGPSPTLGLDELIDDLEAAAVDNKISEITKAQSELEQQRKQLEDASKNAPDYSIKPAEDDTPDKKLQKRLDKLANTIQRLKRESEEFYMTSDQKAVWDALASAGFKYDEVLVDIKGNVQTINPLFQQQASEIAKLALALESTTGPMGQLISESNTLHMAWINNEGSITGFIDSVLKSEQAQNLMVSSLGNLEDEIVNFATNGEFSFKNFATAFIEDLIRICTQMAFTIPLAKAMWAAIQGPTGATKMSTGAGPSVDVGALQSSLNPGAITSSSLPALASGGTVKGKGSGTSDSILARLSNGEYVINARSAAQYRPMLDAINSAPRFAKGGSVGGGDSGMFGGTNIQIIDMRGTDSPPVQTKRGRDSNGQEQIKVFIKQTVSQGFTEGAFDKSLKNNFSIRRPAINRG